MLLRLRDKVCLLLAAFLASAALAQPPVQLVLPAMAPGSEEHTAYFPLLLRLVMEKTEPHDGPFVISYYAYDLTSPRKMLELQRNGVINVMWDGTNAQREHDLLPVRISLLRELNDYRPFLIRREDEVRFRGVRTLADLRRLRAGAGFNWPSVDILRHNGLTVETAVSYTSLFPMLKARRFDYFPRGANEAWVEEKAHEQESLMVEPTLFLHYRVPFYFFVSRDNPALADRIERGLKMAMADGSFDKLLNSYPAYRRGLAEIAAHKRTVIELEMPTLPIADGSSK